MDNPPKDQKASTLTAAACQDAINAALKVATDAIQKAIGLTVL
jgi:hypothetical protein